MSRILGASWVECEDCQGAGVVTNRKYGISPTCNCGYSSGICKLGCFFMSPMYRLCKKCEGMKGHCLDEGNSY